MTLVPNYKIDLCKQIFKDLNAFSSFKIMYSYGTKYYAGICQDPFVPKSPYVDEPRVSTLGSIL